MLKLCSKTWQDTRLTAVERIHLGSNNHQWVIHSHKCSINHQQRNHRHHKCCHLKRQVRHLSLKCPTNSHYPDDVGVNKAD